MPAVHKWGRQYADGEGLRGAVSGYVAADTLAHAAAWALATNVYFDNVSNAAPINNTGIIGNVPTNPQSRSATNDAYRTVMQRMRLTFVTSVGSLVRIGVPAPFISVFLADGVTVDITNVLITNIISVMLTPVSTAVLSDKDGNAANAFVGGLLVQTRFRRKITIWRQTPDETGPEE